MKRKIIKYFSIFIVFAILVAFVCILDSTTVSAYTPDDYSGSLFVHGEENSYQEFIEGNEINKPVLEEDIVIDATKYANFIDIEFEEQVEKMHIDGLDGLYLPETGTVTYNVWKL